MSTKPGDTLSVSATELESIRKKLEDLVKQLPPKEAEVLSLILARAGAATPQDLQQAAKLLSAPAQTPQAASSTGVSLPQLARAVDGVSDPNDPSWYFKIWEYTF